MNGFLRVMSCGLLVVGLVLGLGTMRASAAEDIRQSAVHLGHVASGWIDTPDKLGLLPVAKEDAEVALQHAGYALAKGNTIGVVKAHVGHVLHALDPDRIEAGPGTGYGLVRGMTGVRDHLGYAAQSDDASPGLRKAAPKVIRRAEWVIKRAKVMLVLCEDAERAETLEDSLIMVEEIQSLARQVLGKNGIAGLEAGVDRLIAEESAAVSASESGDRGIAQPAKKTQKKDVKKTVKKKKATRKKNARAPVKKKSSKKSGYYNPYGGSGGDR